MEGKQEETPLKVCPHCAVASRTDADTCPSCGKPYVRGRGPSGGAIRIAIATLVVAGAFLIGFFGISKLIDDEPEAITVEEASRIQTGISRVKLTEQFGEPSSETTVGRRVCLDYPVTDAPADAWLFCFRGDKLATSAPVPE